MGSPVNFIFITLPALFFRCIDYLSSFVSFMFTDFTFNFGTEVLSFAPIEIIFGAGVLVVAGFIIFKFLLKKNRHV